MRKSLSLILLLFPLLACAQFRVTGRVLDATGKPLAGVSIYLGNTTIGAASEADGTFALTNVKSGVYEIILSAVGYAVYTESLRVEQDSHLPDIRLTTHITTLNEVSVKPKTFKASYYEAFKTYFLGTDRYARNCRIVNPVILDFDHDDFRRTLKASTQGFLVIENKELGYTIRYLVKSFEIDSTTMIFSYKGSSAYSEMKGSPGQIKTWLKNRQEIYDGSMMQFLRSCATNSLKPAGFRVVHFSKRIIKDQVQDSLNLLAANERIRSLNKKITDENAIAAKENMTIPKIFYAYADTVKRLRDSIKKSQGADFIDKDSLKTTSFVRYSEGLCKLSFNDALFVFYTKKYDSNTSGVFLPPDMPKYETTVLNKISFDIFFFKNGILLDPNALLMEGKWAAQRVAETLPYDYDPVPH